MTAYNEYGRALFLIAEEEGRTSEIKDDLIAVYTVLKENPDYIKTLDTPAIPKSERLHLADAAFSSVDENLKNLIMILCEQKRLYLYSDVYNTYLSLYDEKMGILKVDAITAIPLAERQREALCKRLGELTGKTVVINNTVDPRILGGVKLRYLGTQVDGSLKTRLDGFAASLKNIVI